jgi:hypothetical protein
MRKYILISTLLFGLGCNVREKNEPSPKHENSVSRSEVDISNSANEFDYIGFYHNKGLYFLQSRSYSWVCDSNEMLEIIERDNNIFLGTEIDTIYNQIKLDEFNASIDTIFRSVRLREIVNLDISSRSKELLSDMAFRLANSSDTTNLLYNIETIKSFEAMLLLDNQISNSEKELLLIGASVLRHSLHYWFNDSYSNLTSIWTYDCVDEPNSRKKKKRRKKIWKEIAHTCVKDLTGAIVGGYYFGAIGAIGLGVLYSASHALGSK